MAPQDGMKRYEEGVFPELVVQGGGACHRVGAPDLVILFKNYSDHWYRATNLTPKECSLWSAFQGQHVKLKMP